MSWIRNDHGEDKLFSMRDLIVNEYRNKLKSIYT